MCLPLRSTVIIFAVLRTNCFITQTTLRWLVYEKRLLQTGLTIWSHERYSVQLIWKVHRKNLNELLVGHVAYVGRSVWDPLVFPLCTPLSNQYLYCSFCNQVQVVVPQLCKTIGEPIALQHEEFNLEFNFMGLGYFSSTILKINVGIYAIQPTPSKQTFLCSSPVEQNHILDFVLQNVLDHISLTVYF